VPEAPADAGRRGPAKGGWAKVVHDQSVTWLAYWKDTIDERQFKYVFLGADSDIKGESDRDKYDKARALTHVIDDIRNLVRKDLKRSLTYVDSATGKKGMYFRQRAVATYLIDKLALRAGGEKDPNESADTVGCCTLRIDNVMPVFDSDGKPVVDDAGMWQIRLNFLGKDSMEYDQTHFVDKDVYDNLLLLIKHGQEQNKKKRPNHDKAQKERNEGKEYPLFDEITPSVLNAFFQELLPGLTAKVFRTYNASKTLEEQLAKKVAAAGGAAAFAKLPLYEKVTRYNEANKDVAILCNHKRSIPLTHRKQLDALGEKRKKLMQTKRELTGKLKILRGGGQLPKEEGKRAMGLDQVKNGLERTLEALKKLDMDEQQRNELADVALGTSKINYMDPRITVAFAKKHEVQIEKLFAATLLAKFGWTMEEVPDFRFLVSKERLAAEIANYGNDDDDEDNTNEE